MTCYWLSFCDPQDGHFLGGCIVTADSLEGAIKSAWQHGCNPGGEIQGVEIDEEHKPGIAKFKINHLYSKQEIIDMGEYRTMEQAIADGDVK